MTDQFKNNNANAASENQDTPVQNATPADAKRQEKKRAASRAVPVLLVGAAAFLGLCFLLKSEGTGIIGSAVAEFLLGLFSFAAHLIPPILLVHAGFWNSDCKEGRRLSRLIFSLLLLFSVSVIGFLVGYGDGEVSFSLGDFYRDGKAYVGGGLIGGAVAFGLEALIGRVGMIVVAALMIGLYVTFFFAGKKSALSRFGNKLLLKFLTLFAAKEKKCKKKETVEVKPEQEKKPPKEVKEKPSKSLAKDCDALLDDNFFAADNGLSSLEISELGIKETKDRNAEEANPILQNKVFNDDLTKKTPRAEADRNAYADDFISRSGDRRESGYQSPAGASQPTGRGLDERADDVFTKEFDPFDLSENAARAAKASSKCESTPFVRYDEPVRTVHEETSEERRKREFEEYKASYFAKQRAAEEEKAREDAERERTAELLRAEQSAQAERERAASLAEEQARVARQRAEMEFERERMAKEAAALAAERQRFEEEKAATRAASQEKPFDVSNLYETAPVKEEDAAEDDSYLRTASEPVTVSYGDFDEEEENAEVTEMPEDESTPYRTAEIPPEKQNPEIEKYRNLFPFLNQDAPEEEKAPSYAAAAAGGDFSDEIQVERVEDTDGETEEEDDEPPFDFERDVASRFTSRMKEENETKKAAPTRYTPPDYSKYRYPSSSLLRPGEAEEDSPEVKAEIEERREALIDVLNSFNVSASIKGVDRGPRVTRYEVVPARGVKVSSVTNLYNDISLGLACDTIRMEAPIPGKSAIGFEIPNRKSQIVCLRDLIESPDFVSAKSKTFSCLGKDVTGNPVFADIAAMPHLLVAGATGMGKSVCINSILISILFRARPDEVKFIMIDPKRVEFKSFDGLPHLLIPVITEAKLAAGALMWAVEEMRRRYDVIETLHVKKIDDYNAKVRENPSLGTPMPKIIIVVDELNDLMLQVRDPVENLIMMIAQTARAAGIHLIIGTQRPSVNVLTGTIKANINSRIACKVSSGVDSRTILDMQGAERLLGRGDMLFNSPGFEKPIRVQGAFVSDEEIETVMNELKKTGEAVYDEEALAAMQAAAQKCDKQKRGDEGEEEDFGGYLSDEEFLGAVDVVLKMGKASTSMIQTKLAIGFQKASRFISVMTDLGIISEETEGRFKKVLIDKNEWAEMLARRELD